VVTRSRTALLSLLSVIGLLTVGVAVVWGVWGGQGFSLRPSQPAAVVAAATEVSVPVTSVPVTSVPVTSTPVTSVPVASAPVAGSPGSEFSWTEVEVLLSDLDESHFDDYDGGPNAWRPDPQSCEGLDHAVIVDRAVQRGWYCSEQQVLSDFVLTSSNLQPDPGDYSVYAKDIQAWSWEFGPPSTMTHFVAFTRGKFKGARIAFHSVPKYSDGSWAQPLDSVGTMEHFGDSSGCIRLLPQDAEAVWDFLELGGTVRVIS
jgi:hypothetical protein